MSKRIVVLAYRNQAAYEAMMGADVETDHCQTLKEAKLRAQYYTSEAYRVVSESSERLGYAQVFVNDVCIFDHFASF